jgi:phospholipid transport system transporter-binding protein
VSQPVVAAATLTATGPGQFAVTGAVTFATAGALLDAGRAQFAGQPAVTVNLKDVSRVDSAGLALLLEWLRQARADQRAVTFTGLPDKLLAIARLGGVDGLLTDGYLGSASGSTPAGSSSSASSSSASSR